MGHFCLCPLFLKSNFQFLFVFKSSNHMLMLVNIWAGILNEVIEVPIS